MQDLGRIIRTGFERAMALQTGRFFLWLPVAFGTGAAVYLSLSFEPDWPWLAIPTLAAMAIMLISQPLNLNLYLSRIALIFLWLMLGLVICKLRTEHVRAPVIPPDQSQYMIQAYVIDIVSPSADAPRLLLAPIAIRGLSPETTPLRLRVSLRPGVLEAMNLKPGDTISTFALLNPPPTPFMPDGYDFAQAAYFQGVGGVGFIPGQPRIIAPLKPGLKLDMLMRLNGLRWYITQSLLRIITPAFTDGPALGGFAAALVTGHQAYIPKALTQDMRDSGLAHILSISGVHMVIVGGFVFFALRAVMALLPGLALRLSIKKVAAGLSMACVLAYLAISGAPAPAVRSAVVACTAFGAILLDRQALSLRALAIAAFVVIALTPEAVIQPGFQMSFSATAALLALAEAINPDLREISVPWWVKRLQAAARAVWLSLVASIVATAATTPFAIAYFNRFSVYGLLSNLFEAPITGFIVMPCLALGTVFLATPLGKVFLHIAAGGLWLIAKIAGLTAALPHAVITWPSAPSWVLALAFIGLIWACLIRGPVRWLGVLAALSILVWPRQTPPDIWIDPQGGNAAILTPSGAYALRPKVRQYGFEQWTRHYGLAPLDVTARNQDYACKGYGCTPLPTARLKVGFWFSNTPPKPERLAELCQASDLVVMRGSLGDWPAECAGVNHISAGDFRKLGALELTRKNKGWTIKAAQPLRGNRYWSSPSEAEGSAF